MVYAKQTKTIILLHKIIPGNGETTGEIHKLDMEFYWKENNRGATNNYDQ